MTMASIEVDSRTLALATNILTLLERVPYIYYPVQFWEDQAKVQVLIASENKVNVMIPRYAFKLGLKV